MSEGGPKPRDLKRPLWAIGLAILALIMLVDLFIHHHPHFERDGITIDTMPEFYPLYGFFACFALVVVAKTIAIALKRKDTYYADD